MKPQHLALRSFLMIAGTILLLQCTKEKSPVMGVMPDNPVNSGTIQDLGAADGEVRQMRVSLFGVKTTLLAIYYEEPLLTSTYVELNLYTPADGMVAEGNYNFSDTAQSAPFTFQDGSMYLTNAETQGLDHFSLSSGSVKVVRQGSFYRIQMEGTLDAGLVISGSFEGHLGYSDDEMQP